MKNYKASAELVEILFKNGFIETTEKHYKKFHDRIIEDGKYDPHKHKRCFSLTKNGLDIHFDYITIKLYNGKSFSKMIETSVSELDLISIIAFYKLPHQTRAGLLRRGNDIRSLVDYVESGKKHPKLYTNKVKRIEESIKSVII